jgi:threonine dehydratase
MVEDGRDPPISEGAGTIGVELLERGDAFDAVALPLGNGALLNGVGRWIKAASPATRVIGVSSQGADAMEKSWREGRVVRRDSVSTLADGIAVRTPIPEALEDMRDLVDDVILVNDDRIVAAMRLLFDSAGVLAEPAGAAGVAALLSCPDDFAGLRVATVVCGSNITADQARRWLQ